MQLIAGCTETYLDIFMLSCRAGICGQIAKEAWVGYKVILSVSLPAHHSHNKPLSNFSVALEF